MKLVIWRSRFTAEKTIVMIIVRVLCEHVEELFDRSRLSSVEALRPSSCPLCGQLAFSAGERLGIVGHGTYRRQVLGYVEFETADTLVRRYLCRGCTHTISVLSDHLHPKRWYSGGAILEALKLYLLDGLSEREIRRHFGVVIDSESWRSLRRWRSELLVTLWYWLARRLGVNRKARMRPESHQRLRRLFGEAARDKALGSFMTARVLLRSTVHFQGHVWPLGRDPPEILTAKDSR